jgi:hypothetical protein
MCIIDKAVSCLSPVEPFCIIFESSVSAVIMSLKTSIRSEPIVNNEYVFCLSHNLKFNHKVHKEAQCSPSHYVVSQHSVMNCVSVKKLKSNLYSIPLKKKIENLH